MLCFDTSYLVRLYTSDPGWQKVRALAQTDRLACCLHGRAETVAAFHRKLRGGVILGKELRILLAEFEHDSEQLSDKPLLTIGIYGPRPRQAPLAERERIEHF